MDKKSKDWDEVVNGNMSSEATLNLSTHSGQPQSSIPPSPNFAPPNVTGPHDIHKRYNLAAPTFKTLFTIEPSPDRRQILHKACLAMEFHLFPIKEAERALFRHINDHTAIPYRLNEAIAEPWHKVFLLVQIDLQRTGWPNKISANGRKELHKDRGRIYRLLDLTLRCLIDILGQRQDGKGVNVALDVLRSVKAEVWEGSTMELLQVQGIGAVNMNKLVEAGINNIKQLSKLQFYHIERLLSRNPPFGHEMLHRTSRFPQLKLRIEVISQYSRHQDLRLSDIRCDTTSESYAIPSIPSQMTVWIVRAVLGFTNQQVPVWKKATLWTTLVIQGADGRLVWFWRGSVKRLVDDKEMVIGLEAGKGEQLKVSFACDSVVGTIIRENLHVQ